MRPAWGWPKPYKYPVYLEILAQNRTNLLRIYTVWANPSHTGRAMQVVPEEDEDPDNVSHLQVRGCVFCVHGRCPIVAPLRRSS